MGIDFTLSLNLNITLDMIVPANLSSGNKLFKPKVSSKPVGENIFWSSNNQARSTTRF